MKIIGMHLLKVAALATRKMMENNLGLSIVCMEAEGCTDFLHWGLEMSRPYSLTYLQEE